MLFWPCCVTNRLHNKGGYTPTVKLSFTRQPKAQQQQQQQALTVWQLEQSYAGVAKSAILILSQQQGHVLSQNSLTLPLAPVNFMLLKLCLRGM